MQFFYWDAKIEELKNKQKNRVVRLLKILVFVIVVFVRNSMQMYGVQAEFICLYHNALLFREIAVYKCNWCYWQLRHWFYVYYLHGIMAGYCTQCRTKMCKVLLRSFTDLFTIQNLYIRQKI